MQTKKSFNQTHSLEINKMHKRGGHFRRLYSNELNRTISFETFNLFELRFFLPLEFCMNTLWWYYPIGQAIIWNSLEIHVCTTFRKEKNNNTHRESWFCGWPRLHICFEFELLKVLRARLCFSYIFIYIYFLKSIVFLLCDCIYLDRFTQR